MQKIMARHATCSVCRPNMLALVLQFRRRSPARPPFILKNGGNSEVSEQPTASTKTYEDMQNFKALSVC